MEEVQQYKQLYHASVERCVNLQEQLGKYSDLLNKHQKIAELKVAIYGCMPRVEIEPLLKFEAR